VRRFEIEEIIAEELSKNTLHIMLKEDVLKMIQEEKERGIFDIEIAWKNAHWGYNTPVFPEIDDE
jgi:hypothetical protein